MYIVYDMNGKILKGKVICPPILSLMQAEDGEFVMEGEANDVTQKVENPGISGKIVDKTPEEIEADKPPSPPEIPFEKLPAQINNKQWQEVLKRLKILETLMG